MSSRARRIGGCFSATLVACAAIAVGWTGPAHAQATDEAGSLLRAVQAAVEVGAVNRRVSEVGQQVIETRQRLAVASLGVEAVAERFSSTSSALDAARVDLARKAAIAYRANGAPLTAVLQLESSQSLNVVHRYSEAATGVDADTVDRLSATLATLGKQRDALLVEVNALGDQMTKLAQLQDDLERQATATQAELERIGGVTVLGTARLTAAEMTAWFESTGHRAHLPVGTSVGDLIAMFVTEGEAEHVRGDLAFAQTVLETGFLRETRGNNFSGIGNCDSCGAQGLAFATPLEGVRAQIQLLRSYADPLSRVANLAHPPDPTLFGSAGSYDRFFLKGKVPLWNQMGNGNWATSTTYAENVLGMYARMLTYAESG